MKRYNKDYFEVYAMLTLSQHYKIDKAKFHTNVEKPDIQNYFDSIGIEVTRAITNHIGFTNSLINKYSDNGISGEKMRKEINREYPDFKGEVYVSEDDVASVFYTKELENLEDYLFTAKKAVKEKSRKYKSYVKFDKNLLYVYIPTSLFSKDKISDFFLEVRHFLVFDGLIINCINKIFFCEGEEVVVWELTEKELQWFGETALELTRC